MITKTELKMKLKWAEGVKEMHESEFAIDGKEKHKKRIHELNGMIEILNELLRK